MLFLRIMTSVPFLIGLELVNVVSDWRASFLLLKRHRDLTLEWIKVSIDG
jgi:hypothetical protein